MNRGKGRVGPTPKRRSAHAGRGSSPFCRGTCSSRHGSLPLSRRALPPPVQSIVNPGQMLDPMQRITTSPALSPASPALPLHHVAPSRASPEASPSQVGLTSAATSAHATGRVPIRHEGNMLDLSHTFSQRMTKIFKERLDVEGSSWKKVSKNTREFYWKRFKKYFPCDEPICAFTEDVWQDEVAVRYENFLNSLRGKGKQSYIPDNVWNKWNEDWKVSEYLAVSTQNSKNHHKEMDGEEVGPSHQAGGSISHAQQKKRIAKLIGCNPTSEELIKRTHTDNHDRHTFIDKRSNDVAGTGWMQEHGVYEISSQASNYYSHEGPRSPSPMLPAQDPDKAEMIRNLKEQIDAQGRIIMELQQELQQMQQQSLEMRSACTTFASQPAPYLIAPISKIGSDQPADGPRSGE
ncbi:uncharacterized protein LOC105640068 isoform X2 [Jatropha curcas]|uniref:uncharacterized protein LOC105640068 isoform X2 n=1 Tax=Jatropha curcas TaxID=180498 RepID=UPI0005FC1234|nr:uncharacterized protein LOC105640068 isoform X2 [Jatropha curcas]